MSLQRARLTPKWRLMTPCGLPPRSSTDMFPSAHLARTSYMSWAKTSVGKAGIGAGGAGGTGGGAAGAGAGAGTGADMAEEEAISLSSTLTLGSLASFGSSLGSLLSLTLLPGPSVTASLSRFLPPSSHDSHLSDINRNLTIRQFGVEIPTTLCGPTLRKFNSL